MIQKIAFLIINIIIAGGAGYMFYLDSRGRDYAWMFWTFLPIIVVVTPPIIGYPLLIVLAVMYLLLRPKAVLDKCPHCKKKVIDSLFVCPFCRKNAKKECLNCHEPVPWEALQCPHCKSRNITKS